MSVKNAGVENVDTWYIIIGPRHDSLMPQNVRRLFILLESGWVLCVWWGTPCNSMSRALKNDGLGPPPQVFEVSRCAPWVT